MSDALRALVPIAVVAIVMLLCMAAAHAMRSVPQVAAAFIRAVTEVELIRYDERGHLDEVVAMAPRSVHLEYSALGRALPGGGLRG